MKLTSYSCNNDNCAKQEDKNSITSWTCMINVNSTESSFKSRHFKSKQQGKWSPSFIYFEWVFTHLYWSSSLLLTANKKMHTHGPMLILTAWELTISRRYFISCIFWMLSLFSCAQIGNIVKTSTLKSWQTNERQSLNQTSVSVSNSWM